jgi:hypothetical protein
MKFVAQAALRFIAVVRSFFDAPPSTTFMAAE